MMKDNLIRKRWTRYIAKKSKVSIALDIVLVLLLVAMVFPASRRTLSSLVIKYTMFQPREAKEVKYLDEAISNWTVQDMDGNLLTLNDLKGRVLFINFWATWCPPCIAEMGGIQKLYNHYNDEVLFLLVSDEESEVIRNFLSKKGYALPVYHHYSGNIPRELISPSIPATYLVSKNGRIVIDKKGAARWDGDRTKKIIDQLLKE
jgi:thiol-disulfide isomerase/thioredoxin